MVGVTSLAGVHRYGLNAAELQTQVAAGTPDKFTSPNGRTFVAPSDASQAAAKLLTSDEATRTWPVPYEAIRTKPEGVGAYPGTMLVYAHVPTKGLPADAASRYAELLKYAAGDGQAPGTSTGQLPPGYLPTTTANSLGTLAAYTRAAADAVAAQSGTVPPVVAGSPATSDAPSGAPSGAGSASTAAGGSSPGAAANSASTPAGRSGTRRSNDAPQQPVSAPGLPGWSRALWPRSARPSHFSLVWLGRSCGGSCTSPQVRSWARLRSGSPPGGGV